MSTAVIALGANLDDPQRQVHEAARRIAGLPGVTVVGRSRLYRTAPVGGPDQPDYVNAVIVVETERGARALLDDLHAIEAEYGRTRDVRWGPRTLDLDLITYDDQRSADPNLELPHPRAYERAFVLVPWRDADPAASLPDHGSVADLLEDRDTSECILLDGVRAGEL